jgi:hypothetical protein
MSAKASRAGRCIYIPLANGKSMYPKKVWVIDIPLHFPFGSAQVQRETPAQPLQPGALGGVGKAESKSKRRGKSKPWEADLGAQLHSRWHMVFAYTLGPLYALLARWSPGNLVWAAFGLASIAAAATAVWFRTEILHSAERNAVGVVPLLAGLCGIILLGATAWARALHLAGWKMQRAPVGELRHPMIVAGLSLLLPGLGLFISGNPRRGALALWMLGPLLISVAILGHAPWLWHLNQNLVEGRIPRSALELVFITAALAALAAAFCWVVQALDGARLVSRLTGRVSHGQPVALALLMTIVVFHLTFNPARVAQVLDQFAIAFCLDGLRVVPLVMELGATKLDPSQPLYAHRAAELYDLLDQRARARQLREDLAARWSAYAKTTRAAEPGVAAVAAIRTIPSLPTSSETAGQDSLQPR